MKRNITWDTGEVFGWMVWGFILGFSFCKLTGW